MIPIDLSAHASFNETIRAYVRYVGKFLFHGNWITAVFLSLTVGASVFLWSGTVRHIRTDRLVVELSSRGIHSTSDYLAYKQANNQNQLARVQAISNALHDNTPLLLGIVTAIFGWLKVRADNRREQTWQAQNPPVSADKSKSNG